MNTEFPDRYRRLGIKIAYYRKLAGLTQAELAERIDKSAAISGAGRGSGNCVWDQSGDTVQNCTRGWCITGKAAGGRGIENQGGAQNERRPVV